MGGTYHVGHQALIFVFIIYTWKHCTFLLMCVSEEVGVFSYIALQS